MTADAIFACGVVIWLALGAIALAWFDEVLAGERGDNLSESDRALLKYWVLGRLLAVALGPVALGYRIRAEIRFRLKNRARNDR